MAVAGGEYPKGVRHAPIQVSRLRGLGLLEDSTFKNSKVPEAGDFAMT